MTNKQTKLLPFILTLAIVALDQFTKWLIVQYIPFGSIGYSVFGGFFQIIHTRNLNAAFSLGHSLPAPLHFIALSVIPLILLGGIIVIYFKDEMFTQPQRWAMAGILGGGIGNLIDRFFRPLGVVDFIDVRFFKALFASGRWPTFNIADTAIVISVACMLLIILFEKNHEKDNTT